MTQKTLKLTISADTSGLRSGTAEARRAVDDFGSAAQGAGRRADQGMRQAGDAVDRLTQQIQRAKQVALGFFGFAAGVELARDLGRIADGYANIQGKLRQVTDGAAQLAEVNDRVFAISQRTSTALDATATLAAKNIRVFLGMGDSMAVAQAKGLALTETLQKALAVSGATGEEARSLVLQLGQALQSGVLQGDEFRSVMENGGRVIKALTDYTGKSVAELRAMAEQGQLTGTLVTNALASAAQKIDTEFGKVPVTIERAWTQLSNAVTRYVGQADQANGASRRVAEGLGVITRNLDAIVGALVTLGEIAAVVYTAKLLRFGAQWIVSLGEQAIAARAAASAAEDMGIRTSGAFAASVREAGLLSAALGTVGAAITGWQIGTYLSEQFVEVRLAATAFVEGTLVGWERVKQYALIAWEGLKAGFDQAVDGMRLKVATFIGEFGQLLSLSIDATTREVGAKVQALALKLAPDPEAVKARAQASGQAILDITKKADEAVGKVREITSGMADYEIAAQGAKGATDGLNTSMAVNPAGELKDKLARLTAEFGKQGAELSKQTAELQGGKAGLIEYQKAQLIAEAATKLHGAELGDFVQKVNASAAGALAAAKAQDAAKQAHKGAADAARGHSGASRELREELSRLRDAEKKHAEELMKQAELSVRAREALRGMVDDLKFEGQLIGASNEERQKAVLLRQAENVLKERGSELSDKEAQGYLDEIARLSDANAQHQLYADQVRETAQRIRGYYESMADALASALTRGGNILKNLGRALVDTLRQIVTDMIAQWLRTRIIGMFMGGGGGWGSLASVGMAAVSSSSGGGSGFGSAVSMGSSIFGGGGSGAGGFSLFSPSSWMDAGKSLWGGFQTAWAGSGQMTTLGSYLGTANFGPGMATTYTPSGLGTTLGLAGAAYGAYQGYRGAGGGVAGVAAGAAYGLGTLTAAGAIGGIATGAGAAAGAAGALGSVGLGAIPVVGWIALAAMALNMITKGGLFGTGYQTKSATQALNIGPDGGDATLSLYQEGKKSLFRGTKRRTKDVAASAEAEQAADDLFKAISDAMTGAAKALQVEVPPVIEASIQTVTEYDKKGHAKATKYLVQAYGQQWEEATAEAAQKRLGAEAILAVVDKASGGVAKGLADRWQSNADALAAGVEFLMAAQTSLTRGTEVLGTTLTDVTNVVTDLAQGSETLSQTYARLTAETKAVQDAFALAGATLQKTGVDLVRFADDIATAAGGGDAAQQLWQRFFTAFYSEAELAQRQVDQLRPRLTTDLTALGLDADTTQAQFRAAFEAALPKLSPDEVVKWLRAADELASFYELSAKAGGAAQDAVRSYAGMVADLDNQMAALAGGGITDFQKALGEIAAAQKNTVAQLNAAARAAGLQGAREEDLSKVHQIAAARAAAAARQLEAQSRDLVQRLYGGGADTLTSAAQSASSALGSVASGLGGVADAASRFRDSMLLDSQLSPLNAQQQLQEAMKQLRATGDEGTARRALEIARGLTASGDDYRQLFDQITALVRPQAASGGGSRGGGYDASASAQQTLSPAERADLAQQLARNVADLSGFGDKTYAEVAQGLGLDLGKLGQDLGLQGQALTDYLDSLKADSYSLDDVDGVITRQVDRIVSAILRGQDVTGSLDTSAVSTSPKGTPETVPPPPSGGLPASASQQAPASAQQADATNSKLDVVASKLDKIADGLLAVARVAAGTGEDTVSALREVEQAVVDVRRELGSSFTTGNVRTLVP